MRRTYLNMYPMKCITRVTKLIKNITIFVNIVIIIFRSNVAHF